jgi:glycosyltransferase involved in cell wall biosynthesis
MLLGEKIKLTNNLKAKVSIITPVYNSESFIEETIKSVVNQTYTNWELILIDDSSIDNSISIINSYREEYSNIKLLKNKSNQGAAVSRNKGIEIALGEFIAFLDSDDIWKSNKLEKQIGLMKKEKLDVSFSSYELINEQGKALSKKVKALPRLTYKKLLKCNYIGNLTGVYRVSTLGKITVPNLRKRQDWLLWLIALKKTKKPVIGIQETLAYYRVREDSISRNKWKLVKYNYLVYRKGLGFSIIKSIAFLLRFLVEYLLIKSKQIKSI